MLTRAGATTSQVLEQSLQAGDEDERVECERLLLGYGDSLTALEDASKTHDQQVARLGRDLARLRDRHGKERSNLKNILLSLKLSLQPATSNKDKMKIELVDEVRYHACKVGLISLIIINWINLQLT